MTHCACILQLHGTATVWNAIIYKPSILRQQWSCHSRLLQDSSLCRRTRCKRHLNVHRTCRSQNSRVALLLWHVISQAVLQTGFINQLYYVLRMFVKIRPHKRVRVALTAFKKKLPYVTFCFIAVLMVTHILTFLLKTVWSDKDWEVELNGHEMHKAKYA